MLLLQIMVFIGMFMTIEAQQNQDFIVECVRSLGIRVIPSPGFRLIQVNCEGQTNRELLPPYNIDSQCITVTGTGSTTDVTVETTSVESPFLGGFQSRTSRVSCMVPDTTGYTDTLPRGITRTDHNPLIFSQGVEPTLTSGVFKFTGVMMTILDRASYAAKQWTDQLAGSAVIGQDLHLTISHSQNGEGVAYIIPQQCRVRPESGNFTTLWHDQSDQPKCLEVEGLMRESFNVFTDTKTNTDVTSLQFYGFQFLGLEKDALTFECDVFLCGDVSGGPCGETWTLLKDTKGCIQSSPISLENRAKRSVGDVTSRNSVSYPAHTLSVRIRVLLPRQHYVASGSSLFSSAVVVVIVLAAKLVGIY